MKNLKKTLITLMAILLIVSGCGKKDNDEDNADTGSDEEVTITYWQHSSPARDKMIESIVEEFNKEHENITVEVEFIPQDDYDQKLITALASDTAPDVFQVQSGIVNKLVAAESILPLDENVMSNDYMEKEFIPATVDALKIDGKYYGVPTDTQTIITFWNKELYKEAGLDPEKGPETWEELFENARKLTKWDGDLMEQSGWGTKGYAPEVEAFVTQRGGKVFDDEKQKFVFADDEKAVAAIKEMASLYREDKVYDEDFEKNWAGFRQGIVAQMLGHPAMIGNLKETAPDVDFGISLIPATDGDHLTTITSWAYVMSKDANTEAATKLINYMSSEEVQKRWTLETGELPARKALLEDSELTGNEELEVPLKSLESATVGHMQTGPLYQLSKDLYERVMHTDEEIEDILDDIQEQMNEEYGKQI